MSRVLICGYYGFANGGDEAILAAMLDELRRRLPGCSPLVTSGSPEATTRQHGVEAVQWNDLAALVTAVRSCDAVVIGGGGLLHNHWPFQPDNVLSSRHGGIAFPASIALLASLLGKRLMVYAIGVGPLHSEEARAATRILLEQAQVTTVRDAESLALLQAIGVSRVELTADPAFTLQASPPELVHGLLDRAGVDAAARPLVGVALRRWTVGIGAEELVQGTAAALDRFLERHGGGVLLLPMQGSDEEPLDDHALAATVRETMRHQDRTGLVPRSCSPQELAGLAAACDLVVGMRYHAILFAATAGRPLVGMLYDDKVRSLLAQLGCEDAGLELAALVQPQRLVETMERVWENRERQVERLEQACRQLRERAQRSSELLGTLLERRDPHPGPLPDGAREQLIRLALHSDEDHRGSAAGIGQLQREIADLAGRRDRLLEERTQLRSRCEQLAAGVQRLRERHEQIGLDQARHQTGLAEETNRIELGGRELARALLQLRSSRSYQLSKLFLALRWLPARSLLRLPLRLLRRLLGRDIPLGLPEAPPVLAMADRLEELDRSTQQLARAVLAPPVSTPDIPLEVDSGLEGRVYATQPLVTVMMPVYNHADMLPQAVASVQAQTYRHWELIILDDGSTDGIDEVFQQLADDPRLRLSRQDNQKLPNALTHLHQLARGELLSWTSADNLLAPRMLERLVAAISEDPATVMVYGDGALIDAAGRPFTRPGYRDHNRDPERPDLLRLPRHVPAVAEECDNFINACFLYRAWAARAVGAHAPDLDCLEDYDFFLRLRRAGACRHVGNAEPLYSYRVHERTMSERVLESDAQGHQERGRLLIELDRRRQAWADRRWQVQLATRLEAPECERLQLLLSRLPVDFVATDAKGAEQGAKLLQLLSATETPDGDGAFIRCLADRYQVGVQRQGLQRIAGEVPRGERLCLLATKSRRQRNPEIYFEFQQAGERRCVAAHMSHAGVDVDAAIALMQAHPELFFLILDHEEHPDSERGNRIAAACNNCIYFGARPYGIQYNGYADLAAVLCLPLEPGVVRPLLQSSLLAVACGRWLLYPASTTPPETLPFAVPYTAGDPLPPVWRLPAPFTLVPDEQLDRWLAWNDEQTCLERALTLATVAGQDLFIERPDFGQLAPEGAQPRVWSGADTRLGNGWIGLWVDQLDRGGLEEVIAMLAGQLAACGQEVRILCSREGGLVADRCRDKGMTCQVFHDDAEAFATYLRDDPPVVLNSHYTWRLWEVPQQLGIPVVETIQNMYAFFDSQRWQEERARSKGYAHAIAVSEMARDYYLRWHAGMAPEQVSVVANTAEPSRTGGRERLLTRRMLGIGDDTCLFLCSASYTARKNQLGLLTAFDRLWHELGDRAALLLVGNAICPPYRDRVSAYLQQLASRQAVTMCDFLQDVGSLLNAADAVVLSSYFEGWSVSGTEALHAGLPLIHTDCGSGRELCADGRGHLVANPGGDPLALDSDRVQASKHCSDPPGTDELVVAMKSVVEHLEGWRARRPEIRSDALRRFSLRRMAREYLQVFNQVLARRAGA